MTGLPKPQQWETDGDGRLLGWQRVLLPAYHHTHHRQTGKLRTGAQERKRETERPRFRT